MQNQKQKTYRHISMHKLLALLLVGVLFLAFLIVLLERNKWSILTKDPTPVPFEEITPSPEPTPTPTPTPTPKPLALPSYSFQTNYKQQAYLPVTEDTTTNFKTSWQLSFVEPAFAEVATTFEKADLSVYTPSGNPSGVLYSRSGFSLLQGSTYTVYISLQSSSNATISFQAVNGDSGSVLHQEDISVSPEVVSKEISFQMTSGSYQNGVLQFACGNVPENTIITISNLRVVSSNPNTSIHINQIGYQPNMQKRCTFPFDQGDIFDVIEADSGHVVYSGPILLKQMDEATGEYASYGDFTNLTTPGKYYIRSQIGDVSNPFVIQNNIFDALQIDALKMLTLQRCGYDLDASYAGGMAHAACHTSQAQIWLTDTVKDVSGGWHDAGDYGRYMKTGAKTVTDLLLAYLHHPTIYHDQTGSLESNNGVADLLDEARYELEWMLKMVGDDGGIYNTVITQTVPGDIDPTQDNQPLYLLYMETTSTADFAGTMALAYLAFEKADPAFAQKCLEAAIQSNIYLDHNLNVVNKVNPSELNGGLYLDDYDLDGRFYTKAALYCATGDPTYLVEAKKIFESDNNCAKGLTWRDNGGYGRYLFLTNQNLQVVEPDFYNALLASLQMDADALLGASKGNAYHSSLSEYGWGSNGEMANNGILLSMAYDMLGNIEYQKVSLEHLNYLLGKNSLDMCFVTGYGYRYPQNIHSRIASSHQAQLNGALIGGPNQFRDDKITQALPENIPNAKMYVDTYECYSTNEIAIYWNGPLIHLLSRNME